MRRASKEEVTAFRRRAKRMEEKKIGLPMIKCPRCGKPNPLDATRCVSCRATIKKERPKTIADEVSKLLAERGEAKEVT